MFGFSLEVLLLQLSNTIACLADLGELMAYSHCKVACHLLKACGEHCPQYLPKLQEFGSNNL